MTYILLMLLLPVIRVQLVSALPSCPASCAVCSEDAIICQRLAHIIDAPDSTQALLLTEGSISTVLPASLSDLSNITVIGLSHNQISELSREAFTRLPFLHTLLLDHNLLTAQALRGGALANLTQLQVLALGHNLISMIEGSWFRGMKALRSLKLEGNLLTSLDSASFPPNDLRGLESLDLSDNLIDRLDTKSFRGLVSLKTLDLSRNRLSSAPAEAFSYLNWLTNVNLDLNSWNCSCQLLELAAFLNTFLQQPDKTLYNGRRMVCVSADNPAVTTVLELTEANCVPSNQNITVRVETRSSVTPQLYARDVAIAAVVCFVGGIALTLLAVLIYYHVRKKRKLQQSQRSKEEGGSGSIVANHVSVERRREIFFEDGGPQWSKDAVPLDGRAEGYGGQTGAEDSGGHFTCANCNTATLSYTVRRDTRLNGGMETDEARERRRVRMMMEEERRRKALQLGSFQSDASHKFRAQSNNSSVQPQRDAFPPRNGPLLPYKAARDMERTDVDGKNRGYETLHCESCHKAYRPPDQIVRQGRPLGHPRDAGFPAQHRPNDGGRNGNRHFDATAHPGSRREARNVRFDLEGPRMTERGRGRGHGEAKQAREASASGGRDKAKDKRHRVQSSRLMKAKLNLNPLKKSKIHPKKKSESEKSSPRKSQEKRRGGKEAEEKERKGRKSKGGGSDQTKKSRETEGSAEEGVKEEGGEDGAEKSKASSKQKGKESTESSRSGDTHPETSEPAAPAAVPGRAQSSQGPQHPAAGSAPGVPQLPPQHPFSLLSADGNRTANLARLTGSSLSLQGGSFPLNSMASAAHALLPGGQVAAPGFSPSGPGMAPSGAPISIGRQAGLGVSSSVNPLLANPLRASVVQTAPLYASQTGGLPVNLGATAGVTSPSLQSLSQNQSLSESSPPKPDPRQGPVLRPQEGPSQRTAESKATTENLPVQHRDHKSEVTPLSLESAIPADNVLNNSQTDAGHAQTGVPTGPISAGVVSPTEAPAAGGSGDSLQAAGGPASGVPASGVPALGLPAQTEASTGGALLQQEYLPGDGGSSPRRKLRLVLPEKTSSRPPTALEKKIR